MSIIVIGASSESGKSTVCRMIEHHLDSMGKDCEVIEVPESPIERLVVGIDVPEISRMCEGVPSVMVADIERGGCFAAIYGTWKLLPEDARSNMKGFIINRFRGDRSILQPAIDIIEDKTGLRCLGVISYFHQGEDHLAHMDEVDLEPLFG